jgi:hypothetical protein
MDFSWLSVAGIGAIATAPGVGDPAATTRGYRHLQRIEGSGSGHIEQAAVSGMSQLTSLKIEFRILNID